MNEMISANDKSLVNPFAAYAEEAGTGNLIKGDLLKFEKGRWTIGQNNTRVADGTTYIADMGELLVGWQCWRNKKVVGASLGAVATGFRPVQRATLGDLDESTWELDDKGRPKDPWVLTSVLYLKDNDGDDVTYSTSSVGGRNAVSDLCKQYGTGMSAHPGAAPIVEIGGDEYTHTKYGLTFVPTLKVVGWEGGNAFAQAQREIEQERSEGRKAPAPATSAKTKF